MDHHLLLLYAPSADSTQSSVDLAILMSSTSAAAGLISTPAITGTVRKK